MIRAGFFKAL